jgi:hypothetical protein
MANGSAGGLTRNSAFASWAVVMQDFARAWFSYGVLAVIMAGVTHGIFHIPLWQVVDVILALFLFYVAFVGCLSLIAFFLDIVGGEVIVSLSRLISIALLPLLPMGAVLGFLAYGFFVEESFEASFVYQGFAGLFVQGYGIAITMVGDVLGVVKTVGQAGSRGVSIDAPQLIFIAQAASVLAALAGFAIGRSRVTFAADDTLKYSPLPLLRR